MSNCVHNCKGRYHNCPCVRHNKVLYGTVCASTVIIPFILGLTWLIVPTVSAFKVVNNLKKLRLISGNLNYINIGKVVCNKSHIQVKIADFRPPAGLGAAYPGPAHLLPGRCARDQRFLDRGSSGQRYFGLLQK